MSSIEIPSDIYPTTVTWGLERPADEHLEGYGMTQLVEAGNARWVATLGWDSIASEDGTREQAQRLASWMDEVSSASNVAILRDRSYVAQGAWTGAPAVAGSSQTGRSLFIRNGTASELMAKRGDYFVVSGQMKRVTRDCRLNASGEGRIWFEPKLVESPANGALLYTDAWCAMYLSQKGHRQAHRAPFFSSSAIELVSPVVDPDEVDGPYVDIVKCAGKKGWLNPNVVHSRASVGYYLGADGYLHDSKNVCLQSQTFDNASWTKTSCTATANQAVAPDGTTTADAVEDAAAGAAGYISQAVTVANDGAAWTCSVFIKKRTTGTHNVLLDVQLTGGTPVNPYILIDPVTGAINGSGAYDVEDHGTYWRVYATAVNNASGNTTLTVYVYVAYNAVMSPISGTAATVGVTHLWGAQIVRGRQPGLYAVTTTTANGAPRFEWDTSNDVVGFLTEGERTNLALQSETFDNVAWTKTRASITANAATAPDGNTTADKLVEDATAGASHVVSSAAAITVAGSTVHTTTVYAKAAERSWIVLAEGVGVTAQASFNLGSGVVGTTSGTGTPTSSITAMGNGWYRCEMQWTSSGTSAQVAIYLATADATISYNGDGASGVYLWGAQLEQGQTASSYIPTTTASATRASDTTTATPSTVGFNESEGTLFVEFDYVSRGSSPLSSRFALGVDDSVGNHTHYIYNQSLKSAGYLSQVSGLTETAIPALAAVAAATMVSAAVAYALNDRELYVDGVSQGTDTVAKNPASLNRFALGLPLYGRIRRARIYPRRLTTIELASLTA